MWAPSTSASVRKITLWYRALAMSNSSPIPVPTAVMIPWTSSFWRARASRAFSTLRIFPLMGRIAWISESLACLAGPAAEAPSTMNNSLSPGSRDEQSASLPGRLALSSAVLRLVSSRALRAASRALAALMHFSTICRASGE